MHPPQPFDPFLEVLPGAALHGLDIATAQNPRPAPVTTITDSGIPAQVLQCFTQGEQHCLRKGVRPIGPIEGQPNNPVLGRFQ
jgi:hypothetical protein